MDSLHSFSSLLFMSKAWDIFIRGSCKIYDMEQLKVNPLEV